MGTIGGSAFHFSKGLYSSPNGARFIGATQAVGLKAGRIGGSFAVWSVLFSTFDCSMVYIRKKEDPWNSILSAAATGGLLSMRRGFAASAKSAAFGAVLLGLIEGTGIALNKYSSAQQDMPPVMIEDMPPQPPKSSWFGRLFGGAKEEEKIANGGSEVKILETYDAPPLPSFEYK
ncbi:mitochondrial import inner membrane translocase subunit TIM17-2-like [Trifolium pratense]|nr:mitochondrial import inner membrane translocase subunit TIM17-2-like [Trifolium pratense]